MITIEVQDYCSGCEDFNPDVHRPIYGYDFSERVLVQDSVVYCKHHTKCEAMYERIKEKERNDRGY